MATALFQDVPDIAGDEQAGIRTLAVQMGARGVVNLSTFITGLAYTAAVGFWATRGHPATAAAHLVLGAVYSDVGIILTHLSSLASAKAVTAVPNWSVLIPTFGLSCSTLRNLLRADCRTSGCLLCLNWGLQAGAEAAPHGGGRAAHCARDLGVIHDDMEGPFSQNTWCCY